MSVTVEQSNPDYSFTLGDAPIMVNDWRVAHGAIAWATRAHRLTRCRIKH